MSEGHYELLDFGNGRKLERFGKFILDRPSPPAVNFRKTYTSSFWQNADAVFERQSGLRGKWFFRRRIPSFWQGHFGEFSLELKPTDVGHLGIFAEQQENWKWISACAKKCLQFRNSLRVLNLFAYTGGSTLAAASCFSAFYANRVSSGNSGFSNHSEIEKSVSEYDLFPEEWREKYFVTHVDSAKNMLPWARKNANISGMDAFPIRWIPEDALKFSKREVRRGKIYDAVILDPPTYGHGKGTETWKIERDLPRLLELCVELTLGNPAFFLLTAHSPDFPVARVSECVRKYFPKYQKMESGEMFLCTKDGRKLPSGVMARLDNTVMPIHRSDK
ncbi:MAG: class I SAM-dependent methyltransferase [Planctomycetia bacterium]|nr:class I SAM-dependent methyltransferase [Planctomycetia bacterium]